jgi:virulence factor Mce-like protein
MTHLALPRSRRSITITVIVAVVLLAIGGGVWWYASDRVGRTEFSAMFPESVGIYPGSDVRVLGVAVGAVDSVHPEGTSVRISMHLDDGVSVRADTDAVIISPSLVSDRYVQLTGVYTSGPKLQNGTTLPLSRTATSVEIDQLSSGIVKLTQALGPNGANKNGAFADLLNVGAANLRGNGAAMKQTLQRLSQLAGTLSGNKGDFFKTISNLSTFTNTLAKDDQSVRGLNTALSTVSQVLANDRQSFTDSLHELAGALTTVKNFIQNNRALISSNVKKLAVITQALSDERASLAQALHSAPVAVDNLINAYDAKHHTLDGRGNLNELSIWHTGSSGPPLLLPSTGDTKVSGGQ